MTLSRLDIAGKKKLTKPVLCLVGGIGSGKSFVASLFKEFGAAIIDADKLGHEALRHPEIREQVIRRWGREVLDETGQINRRHLGLIVFSDASERQALEAIVFPYIDRRIMEELEQAERDPKVDLMVLDAAILLETGWGEVGDLLVFVDTPRAIRLKRIAEQRGWSAQEVESREHAQMDVQRKAELADEIITNAGDATETRRQVEQLVRKLRRRMPSRN